MLRNIVACCAIVLAFDAAASSIAKHAGFPYGYFAVPELAMYAIMGFVLERRTRFGMPTMLPVVLAACVEATIGWWISVAMGAGRAPLGDPELTAFSAVTAALLFTALGALGMWLAYGFKRPSKNSDVA